MPQLTLDSTRAHLNRQLFSNHFLEARLRRSEEWEAVAEEASRVRARLKERLEAKEGVLEGANEAQTEEHWIQPVLREMGWGFEVQPRSKRQGQVRFPDYALFPDQEAADEAARARADDAARGHRGVLKRSVGVAEAKRWGRDLDAGEGADRKTPDRVPSAQIINYLIRAEQPWGVLTNGAEWRIYHRDADFADTVYFAVDLPALLRDAPLLIGEKGEEISAEEAFRYFYLFFRPTAFTPEPDRPRWLERALQSSLRYARAVEDALKPRAYRAVTALCRGFAKARGLEASTVAAAPSTAREILDDALTVLFRLLFLLHAESRELLPLRTNAAYRSKSLLRLRERAAEVRDGTLEVFARGDDLWHDLHDLFQIVDGHERWRDVGVPVYNGGLFDPDKHPRLERHDVTDPEMAEALDLLSRVEDPETGRLHFVDYGPLDVRHLGSIYEGLLEYVLRVAEDDLEPLGEGGRVVRDAVPAGALYLATDKGERKVSGSFYTPDYVVEYIVERTLKPLTEGRDVREILELRVLDPAMGSGHFLVEATSFLAREAVRAAEEGPQALLGDFARLDPEHLRRLVVEQCIFGVDLNPRAVELAKLALWLATVQKGKPLNFLDHHLKLGDSLLGARLRSLGRLPGKGGKEARLEEAGQINPFEYSFRQRVGGVLALVRQIEDLPSETLDEVETKETLHQDAEGQLDRYRAVADLWCGSLLGAVITEKEYGYALNALQGTAEDRKRIEESEWARRAADAVRGHRFFHWEVEFSEVFFGEDGTGPESPGFDAVIGNPPYVRMEEFKEIKPFLRHEYDSHATRADLYVYFIERSLDLLRDGGRYGVIVSNKFLRAGYGKGIRELMGERAGVEEIVDFGELPVFEDAAAMPAIIIASAGEGTIAPRFTQVSDLDFPDLSELVQDIGFEMDEAATSGEDWFLVSREVSRVLDRMRAAGRRLGDVEGIRIGWGIKTGLNAAFVIDGSTRAELIEGDPRSGEVIKPLVVGNDLRHYHINREDSWILYLPHGIDITRYPAVEEYLLPFRERLEGRATSQEWYELQQPQEAYEQFFQGEKILYPEIGMEPRFCWDDEGLYPNNKCFFISGADFPLLAILNSSASFFYLAQICSVLGDPGKRGRLEFRQQYMEELPIPLPEPGNDEVPERIGQELISLYGEADLDSAEPFADLLERIDAISAPPADRTARSRPGSAALFGLLGHLAREMTDLHRRRLAEMRSFLAWLEGRVGCSIDDLSGKTYVREYHLQPEGVEKLLEVLERNHPARTKLDVSAAEDYGDQNPERNRIKEGFERSMTALIPLLRSIEETDRLIDEVVYRLYGFSAEDIAVVQNTDSHAER